MIRHITINGSGIIRPPVKNEIGKYDDGFMIGGEFFTREELIEKGLWGQEIVEGTPERMIKREPPRWMRGLPGLQERWWRKQFPAEFEEEEKKEDWDLEIDDWWERIKQYFDFIVPDMSGVEMEDITGISSIVVILVIIIILMLFLR